MRYEPRAERAFSRSWRGWLTPRAWGRGSEQGAHGRSETLGDKLRQRDHSQNGFDTIRLAAAALVLLSHSYAIGTGTNSREPLIVLTRGQDTFGGLSVGIFFFISGLLISNSFEARRDLASFVRKRVLRIMPALIVVCCLLVGVLGPIATDLPLSAYFRGAWRFMGQALFLPAPYGLPGVFEAHPLSAVDGSLWSLKFEVACYAGAAALLAWKPVRMASALALWLSSFFFARWLNEGVGQPTAFFYLGTMAGLYRFFGAGVLIYLLRERIVLSSRAAWLALAACLLSILTPFFMEAASTFGAYALLIFGYRCPAWFRKVTAHGDISYGTYLYAFPIQQLVFSLVGEHPWRISALSLPLTLIAATASWVLVERPALNLKRARAPRRQDPAVAEPGPAGEPYGSPKLPTW